MATPSIFLIAGGTGRQGGAVVDALLLNTISPVLPSNIYVLTRNLEGPAAVKLAKRGVSLVQGNLSQPDTIFEELKSRGVRYDQAAAFLAQAHGPTEVTDATGFIDAAINHKLRYFVYSSVDRGGKELSDRDASYCKTFSDKFLIEKHLQDATAKTDMNFTNLRPTWFVENALWGFPGRLCMTGWRENMNGKCMQVVTAKDLGQWGVEALLRPDHSGIKNTAISVASDELTFQEFDDIFVQETGAPIGVTYGFLARFMIWAVKDLRTMFGWIGERSYGADLAELAKTVEPTTVRQWVKENAAA